MPQLAGSEAPGRQGSARRIPASPPVTDGHGVVDIMLGGLPPRKRWQVAVDTEDVLTSSAAEKRAMPESDAQSSMRRDRRPSGRSPRSGERAPPWPGGRSLTSSNP